MAVVAAIAFLFACGGSSGDSGSDNERDEERPGESVSLASVERPTRLAWGPDGRLYVATLFGRIHAFRFDVAGRIVDEDHYQPFAGRSDAEILGIAFDPRSDDSLVEIYVAHADISTGACEDPEHPYTGRISRLRSPDFDVPETVVSGLPSGRSTHGINGITFDELGGLFVAVAGMTNAGVASCAFGGIPETPLSAAIVRFDLTTSPGIFDLQYRQRSDGALDDNQVNGASVDLVDLPGLSIFATGFRNAFTVRFGSNAALYAVDNGANDNAGDASKSATTQVAIDHDIDTFDRVIEGGYYGHPNRNRGRDDDRENVYVAGNESPPPHGVSAPLLELKSTTNGLTEWRSNAWGEAQRGAWILQQWEGETVVARLDASGEVVTSLEVLDLDFPVLDVVAGPEGALLGTDFNGNALRRISADSITAVAPGLDPPEDEFRVDDLQPWRGPASGGIPFVLSGAGFGRERADVEVRFDGVVAELTALRDNRIHGRVPVLSALAPRAVDDASAVGFEVGIAVEVTVDGETRTLANAFRPIPGIVR